MQQENLKPILPTNPTTLDRIIYAINMLRYSKMEIVAVCSLTTLRLLGFTGTTHYCDDKLKMLNKAKTILKQQKLTAKVSDNNILSGHLFQVRHNNQSVALIIVKEEITPQQIALLQLPISFVTVRETYSGSGKKNNVTNSPAGNAPIELTKQEKKAKRYERVGKLVNA